MSDELKPCPFCSSEAELIEKESGVYFVRCIGCYTASFPLLEPPQWTIERWNERGKARVIELKRAEKGDET